MNAVGESKIFVDKTFFLPFSHHDSLSDPIIAANGLSSLPFLLFFFVYKTFLSKNQNFERNLLSDPKCKQKKTKMKWFKTDKNPWQGRDSLSWCVKIEFVYALWRIEVDFRFVSQMNIVALTLVCCNICSWD